MEVSPRFQICHRETQTNHCGCKDVKALPALLETHPSSGALDAVKPVYLLDDVTSVSILTQHYLQIKQGYINGKLSFFVTDHLFVVVSIYKHALCASPPLKGFQAYTTLRYLRIFQTIYNISLSEKLYFG